VLGHEVAHIAARHMTCRLSRKQILRLLAVPAVAVASRGRLINQVHAAGTAAALTVITRRDEAEADYLGTQYSYAAGYDPNGAVRVQEKMNREHPDSLLCLILGDPPPLVSRIEKTQKEIQKILPAKPDYLVTTSEYHDVGERLMTLEDRPQNLKRAPGGRGGGTPPKVERRDAVE